MENENISKGMTAEKAVVVIKENPVVGEMLMGLCDFGLVSALLEYENLDEGVSCLIKAGYTEFEIGFAVASAVLMVTVPTISVIGSTMCSDSKDESDAAMNN